MSKQSTDTNRVGALLSSSSRVEAPFVCVKIGSYEFGVYKADYSGFIDVGVYKSMATKYPNYVNSLKVKKVNGTVNQYELSIKYPVTNGVDPNFFEKIFGRVSYKRTIEFSYGDFMMPNYIYKKEEAIITDISTQFDLRSSVISYTVKAVSTSTLSLSGCFTFPAKSAKPSDVIYKMLYEGNQLYRLLDIFPGMKDRKKVESNNFIFGNDQSVQIPTVTNVSALEYISILVSYMTPIGSSKNSTKKSGVCTLTTYEDPDGTMGGSYFQVKQIQTETNTLNKLCTYEIDIGYQSANIVTDFRIVNSNTWSLYYEYNKETDTTPDYVKTIDDNGEISYIYSPQLTGTQYYLTESDRTWWTRVTEFPINAEITVKGLLKPAILMQYVKLNVLFYGRKHISSGYYIITSQEDTIDSSGYRTTLGLTRVAKDEGEEIGDY